MLKILETIAYIWEDEMVRFLILHYFPGTLSQRYIHLLRLQSFSSQLHVFWCHCASSRTELHTEMKLPTCFWLFLCPFFYVFSKFRACQCQQLWVKTSVGKHVLVKCPLVNNLVFVGRTVSVTTLTPAPVAQKWPQTVRKWMRASMVPIELDHKTRKQADLVRGTVLCQLLS